MNGTAPTNPFVVYWMTTSDWKGVSCLLLASALTILLCSSAFSQRLVDQRNLMFDKLGTEDGLSQGGVTSVTQDQHGFIWIGTQEGLNRYDGYRFETFYHVEGAPGSLSHNSIWALLADDQGRLWIGTDAGLNRFNRSTRTFETIPLGNPGSAEPTIYALYEDIDGNVWVGSSLGLTRIGRGGDKEQYRYESDNPAGLGAGSVRALHGNGQALWIGTERGGLNRLDLETNRFEHYVHEPGNPRSLSDNYVRDIIVDANQQLWVATFNGGVSVFDPITGHFRRLMASAADPASLASNRVRALLRDHNDDIWVGTDSGLHLWHPVTGSFSRYVVDRTNPRSLSDNTVFSISQDRSGVVWVGTFNGISKWNARVPGFPHYRLPTGTSTTSSSSTSSFAEAGNGDLWIGTFAGLYRWREVTQTIDPVSPGGLGLSDIRVMSLLFDGDVLWAGTMAGGINLLAGGDVTATYRAGTGQGDLSSNAISSIYKDSQSRIWLTTYGGGVNRYLGEGKFRRYPEGDDPSQAFSDLRTLDIVEASDGNFWIAADGGGVVILNPDSGETMTFRHDASDPGSLSSDNVITLLKTDQYIWVGTRDRGLNRYNPASGDFTRFTRQQGLASDAVYGMLEDANGRIWVSGGKGLSVLDPVSLDVARYDSTHGLQADDFNSGAFLSLSDGSFVFGGNNGFNAFDPDTVRRNAYVPPVAITGFTLFNKTYDLPRPVFVTDNIELEHADSVIGFEFAAFDYTAPEKNRFQYKLEGFDPGWMEAGGARQVTYTNLDPGGYTFRVRGSNNDGVWNRDGAAIGITVNPPLWATWWAYCAYALLALILLWQLLQMNARRQRFAAEKRYSERLQLYIESLEEASDCVLIADSAGTLLYANNAIQRILGRKPVDAVGQPMISVVFENQDDSEDALAALDKQGRYHGEVTVTGKGGTRTNDVTIAMVRESSEQGAAYVCISRDITDRKITESELEDHRRNLENLVADRTRALEKEIAENKAAQHSLANSLEEKELLLKEVHHRVKNNMQVISSLLNIQAETAGSEVFANLLGESQQRIKSMALIHENLYQSDNLLEIDFEDYINMLTNSLCRFYAVPGVRVQLDVEVADIALDLETAVPCGLIINELVSNSLKHAFRGHVGNGRISVSFLRSGCGYLLRVHDDGKGLPAEFSIEKSSSMGMEIVSILTHQLDGELRLIEGTGTTFEIQFPHKVKHG